MGRFISGFCAQSPQPQEARVSDTPADTDWLLDVLHELVHAHTGEGAVCVFLPTDSEPGPDGAGRSTGNEPRRTGRLV